MIVQLNMRALEGLAELGIRLARPCPTCGAPSRRDAPHLAVLDSTCTACGQHFTTREKPKGMEQAIERLEAHAQLAVTFVRAPARQLAGSIRARARARALRLKYL